VIEVRPPLMRPVLLGEFAKPRVVRQAGSRGYSRSGAACFDPPLLFEA
jgi:hypothetical protein